MKKLFVSLLLILSYSFCFAQHSDDTRNQQQLTAYQDSLKQLGDTFVNNDNDLERKNANYEFIRTLVKALRVPSSFNFKFDSLKQISILNSPDNRFRIFTWHVIFEDGSSRFYGAVQMNTAGGPLKLFPLEDTSPMMKNPEDSVTGARQWYGAQYYKIVPVYAEHPYYLLLGWKGNTVKSNKKVIDIISFGKDGSPEFGRPVFDGDGKTRMRIVFEYTRQASMLLRYEPSQNLIVFDHLSPPDKKLKGDPSAFGPDLSYDGYKLKNGRWVYVQNLDMRNVPTESDDQLVDPKIQALQDRNAVPVKNQ